MLGFIEIEDRQNDTKMTTKKMHKLQCITNNIHSNKAMLVPCTFHIDKYIFLYFHQLTHNQQKSSVSELMVDPVVTLRNNWSCVQSESDIILKNLLFCTL